MAGAAAYPPWVIFEHYCTLEVQGCSSSIADTNTLARCRTTAGHPINVSLCLAAPPEGSRVCVQLPAGIVTPYAAVLAAHGDSVVVQVGPIEDRRTLFGTKSTDHFVYSAGDAAAEPPGRCPHLDAVHTWTFIRDINLHQMTLLHHAYAIHTWTLRMDVDMAWVMDGSLDASQVFVL
jgi:uncharacterized protein YcgI (DUF1989 family)